jgi:hypothetical protein
MSHRPRLHKKYFSSCGHRGFGQYCHRCTDIAYRKQTIVAESKILHDQWLQTYEQDSVDLRKLPKHIVIKARQILEQLAQGTEYYKLKGKRLLGIDRDLIRIPVTRRYRLLIKDIGDNMFEALKVLSHEAYNAIAHRGL